MDHSPPKANTEELSVEELRRRLDGLNRLLEVTRALAEEIDLKKILKTIIKRACEALDCDRASLYQYDPEGEELFTSAVTELEIDEIRNGLDTGISGYVARNKALANIPDPSQDARWNSTVDQATGYKTRNILAAPISSPHDGHLLGVLSTINKHEGTFDKLDEELITAFSQHAAAALDRARLVEELKRSQQTEASLEAAREIQRTFMPDRMPEIPGYEAACWWYPQQEVGGDYCDLLVLRDGRIGLCVADVCGHGLGPSLMMASVRAALHALLLDHMSPDVLLELLARALVEDFNRGTFITMVMAIIDPQTHHLEYSNAGHEPAMHYDSASGEITTLRATSMPLGVVEGADYPLGTPRQLQVGDLILLCTDGIVEALNAAGNRFGQQRLEDYVRRHAQIPIQEFVDGLGEEVSAYYDGDDPTDDLTILALRRTAEASES